jgi:hypothetical protein
MVAGNDPSLADDGSMKSDIGIPEKPYNRPMRAANEVSVVFHSVLSEYYQL